MEQGGTNSRTLYPGQRHLDSVSKGLVVQFNYPDAVPPKASTLVCVSSIQASPEILERERKGEFKYYSLWDSANPELVAIFNKCMVFTSADMAMNNHFIITYNLFIMHAPIGARLFVVPRWSFDDVYYFKDTRPIYDKVIASNPVRFVLQECVVLPGYNEMFYKTWKVLLNCSDITVKIFNRTHRTMLTFRKLKPPPSTLTLDDVYNLDIYDRLGKELYRTKTDEYLNPKGIGIVVELASGGYPPPTPKRATRYICIDSKSAPEKTKERVMKGELEYYSHNLNYPIDDPELKRAIGEANVFLCKNICTGDPMMSCIRFFLDHSAPGVKMYMLPSWFLDNRYTYFKEFRAYYDRLIAKDPAELVVQNCNKYYKSSQFKEWKQLLNRGSVSFKYVSKLGRMMVTFTKGR